MRLLGAVVGAGIGVALLASCSDANVADLKGVHGVHPDRIEVVVNIDGHPNMDRICVGGLAFYTVTDDHMAPRQVTPFVRVPEWDASFCGAAAK